MTVEIKQITQGSSFQLSVDLVSTTPIDAWIVFAVGKGTPSPGAGFRPVYSGGNYFGWFPYGFDPDVARMIPNVSLRSLVAGHNSVVVGSSAGQDQPLGEYTMYVAVIPPAANWYQWDTPYDQKAGPPFGVIAAPPNIVVAGEISQVAMIDVVPSMAYLYGAEGDSINHFGPGTHPYCTQFPDSCGVAPYMKFHRLDSVTYQSLWWSNRQSWKFLYLGASLIAGFPPNRNYLVKLQGKLTLPGGTMIERTLTVGVPPGVSWTTTLYTLGHSSDILDVPAGQYIYWLRKLVDGVIVGEITLAFTVE